MRLADLNGAGGPRLDDLAARDTDARAQAPATHGDAAGAAVDAAATVGSSDFAPAQPSGMDLSVASLADIGSLGGGGGGGSDGLNPISGSRGGSDSGSIGAPGGSSAGGGGGSNGAGRREPSGTGGSGPASGGLRDNIPQPIGGIALASPGGGASSASAADPSINGETHSQSLQALPTFSSSPPPPAPSDPSLGSAALEPSRGSVLAAVPEPATWGLMLIGVAGVGAIRRRARRGYA